MKRLLTPRQVAQSLGVSESSLKRWCDRGDLPFKRTVGGHRRIAIPAVVRFLRENQREVVRPDILGLPAQTRRSATILDNSIQVLSGALVTGDVEASRRIVLEFFMSGHTVARICDELLAPALSLIGDRWECGDVEVFEEHRAVELIVRLLHEIRLTIEKTGANSLVAMGSSVEGDMYGLPTRMVELTLLETGWKATSLGTSLPFDALLSAVHQNHPRLLWLSVSVVNDEEQFVKSLNSFCEQVPSTTAVVVGGRALTSDLRHQLWQATCCDDLQQLSAHADNLRTSDIAKAG